MTTEQKERVLAQYDRLGDLIGEKDFSKQECVLLGFCVGLEAPIEVFEAMLHVVREAQK